jgi:hypothetical protein
MSNAEIDLAVEEHIEREREAADERAVIGDAQAQRPDAVRQTVTFGDLVLGDHMTAEEGPQARWVKVVKIVPAEDTGILSVTFQTPQPLGLAWEDRWIIERRSEVAVVVDASARGDGQEWPC